MKKKILFIVGMLTIVFIAAINFNFRNNNVILTGLSLTNIEMLAQAYELPEFTITCGQYDGACWEIMFFYPWTPCEFNGSPYFTCRK